MELTGELTGADRRLVTAMGPGLPLCRRPFREIGARAGLSEKNVITALKRMLEAGIISRLGVVVRHHELGYKANAMVVWDIADEDVDQIGERFKTFDFITLCYRRKRRPPQWPYNLFSMIHGRERQAVLAQVDELARACGLEDAPREILFSGRRFKQRGAVYNSGGAL
ncbi:MAG TPA: Lrp/AsnC family transcriptional regulator [Rhodospirillales bacterium]|nr:Lrp/AsnC family transcriptional regulator [Rhodospirillales bacterium]